MIHKFLSGGEEDYDYKYEFKSDNIYYIFLY